MSFFNEAYKGTPPWDIGRPQHDFEVLAEDSGTSRDVIDLGCGTGEHSVLFASKGHRVLGIDSAPLAIEKARAKAKSRRSSAEFQLANATELASLGRTFDLGIDSGLFHVFGDRERVDYVSGLSSVIRQGGRFYLLCFSDQEEDWGGPRRIKKDEIMASFSEGWRVDFIRPSNFVSKEGWPVAKAWFCGIQRTP